MATFYEVKLNGSYLGKDNVNTLYYRTALDLANGVFGFGGAKELAEEVEQEVVPAFLAVKPADYTLQTIDVTPRNGLFELLYQLPYKREVNRVGTNPGWDSGTDGPALSINVRFNLEPTVLGLQSFTAPKRGYVAVGPVKSAWVDNYGKLAASLFSDPANEWRILADKLSSNLESIDPPAIWFPVRVAQHYGSPTGGLLGWGYADVMSASIDEYVSFRRSRRITG